jgi:endonuclease/exonuclease/phosphatase family metal-dependent hydrolase
LEEIPISQIQQFIRVATYNIRQCFGLDGIHNPLRVAEVLHEIDADMVGLQEVSTRRLDQMGRHQLDIISKELGMSYVVGPTIREQKWVYGNGLLSRLPIAEVRTFDLSIPGMEPRGGIDTDIECNGTLIRVITTHLGLNSRQRSIQVRRLLRVMGQLKQKMTIVLGDFNEWRPWNNTVSNIEHLLGKVPLHCTFPAWLPVLPLDRLWVKPTNTISSMTVHKSFLAKIASDHLPLYAVIRHSPQHTIIS